MLTPRQTGMVLALILGLAIVAREAIIRLIRSDRGEVLQVTTGTPLNVVWEVLCDAQGEATAARIRSGVEQGTIRLEWI